MILDYLDTGERCDRHVGEVFPPRCADCGTASDTPQQPRRPRVQYVHGAMCPVHVGYPMKTTGRCDRCDRDEQEVP